MKFALKFGAVAAVASLGLAFPVGAQVKERPPQGGEPRDFKLPTVETYELSNGVKVTLVSHGRVPKTTIGVVVRTGNLNDGGKPWIADLTAEMMTEGAAEKNASELALAAASMGGSLSISTGLDQTFVTMDVLSESAPAAVALMSDVLQRPAFPESKFDQVKTSLLRNLSVSASQPQAMANDAFVSMMYPGHPYARAALPDPSQVAALTLADVKAYYASNFGGQRTHIYVVGRFDFAMLKNAISKRFGAWRKGPSALVLLPGKALGPAVRLVNRPGAVQSTIRFGKRVPPIDGAVDLEVTNTLLGGYFSSRIVRNIREDKGYTYSPGSAINWVYKAANWRQAADITSEATGPALAEIIKEIRGLQAKPPPDAELQGAKNYVNGAFVIQLASRGGIANRLAFVDLHGLGLGYLENYVSAVRALTPGDIQKAARTHLSVEEMSLVVVGDIASVRSQLQSLPDFATRLPAAQ